MKKQAVWMMAAGLVLAGGFAAAAATMGGHDHAAMLAGTHVPSPVHLAYAPMAIVSPEASEGHASAPTLQDALTRLERLRDVHIHERADFNPENGVRRGTGTLEDPFVFEGIYTPRFSIEDVEAAYVIRDVYVSGKMQLDYTGAGGRVENSTIGFLLTDTNREHQAPHTWLDVRDNVIGAARIRHAGGVFANNLVGTPGRLDGERLALEVQGYNGLVLSGNQMYGPVEFRLHGHHYATSFEETWMQGHHHGDPAQRYHAVKVTDNLFADASGRGVVLSDRDHAQNHGTAASEKDPRLDERHAHHLVFEFERNRLVGGGLEIERPNEANEKHTGGDATYLVRANVIEDPLEGTGIEVRSLRDGVDVRLEENTVRSSSGRIADGAGILLRKAEGGTLHVVGGVVRGFEHGVRASDVHASASWSVTGTATDDVGRAVWWDKSVHAPPAIS